MSLSPLAIVAIGKVLKGDDVKEASKKLTVGDHSIDETFRIKGTLSKAADHVQVVSMSLPAWKIIAVLLSKLNGVTIESVLDEAMDPKKAEDFGNDIKKSATKALEKYKANAGTETVTGRVDTDLVVDTAAAFNAETVVSKPTTKKAAKKGKEKVEAE